MDSATWAWGGVDKRGRLVRSPQAGQGPGSSLLPAVKVRFQQVFLGFQKLPPAAATWLWLMGGPSLPHPRSHEDGAPAGQPRPHGQPA